LSTGMFSMAIIEWVDMAGSATMILLALLAVRQAFLLRQKDPQNIMWTYLVWFCSGLLVFSLSRSLGHILKHVLLSMNLEPIWNHLRPFSGSLNTITFVIAGAITLFFSRVYRTYQRMLLDKVTIEKAHHEIAQLNVNLEKKVASRTRDLAASEEKYRRIFENSKDMLFICDTSGKILDMNSSGVEMLDFPDRETLIGRNFFKDFFQDSEIAEKVKTNLETMGFIQDAELRLRTNQRKELMVLFSGSLTRGEGGRPIGFEGIVKDITSRRKMEMQLMQADKLASLGQLSAGIAHEINNPLGLVLGYTRLIFKETHKTAPFYDDLKVIEKHALNCKKIVENLLKFSRATSTTKAPAVINQLVGEIIAVVEHKFKLENVLIQNSLSPELPTTLVDRDKINQVFMNILMNARQAIEGAGTIAVTSAWEPETRQIHISFEDNGSGIPPEILPKIFDPFFTTKPIGMGTGLGLAVSYGIVKDHEGEIRVESRPGQGSRFTVILPILEPERGKEHPEKADP
jgi:two-component system, NtrC family, sensor kinase